MIISLNPSYYCNFRCPFCYLTPEQLADKKTISLDNVYQKFTEVISYGNEIECVDLYGGEISQLGADYAHSLLSIPRGFRVPRINIISNLSSIPPYFYDDDINLYVSYDYKARQDHKAVMENMRRINKDFSILMLASKGVLKFNPDEIITELNSLERLVSLEIKPYSVNQANQFTVSNRDYEEFVKSFITSPVKKNFDFENEFLIQDSLSGHNNSFSDDHVYITPSGKYAVLEFDDNDREYFLELDTFADYIKWTQTEKQRVKLNQYCSSCQYYGTCLSEHLREVKDNGDSCSGYKGLLDWYGRERMEV